MIQWFARHWLRHVSVRSGMQRRDATRASRQAQAEAADAAAIAGAAKSDVAIGTCNSWPATRECCLPAACATCPAPSPARAPPLPPHHAPPRHSRKLPWFSHALPRHPSAASGEAAAQAIFHANHAVEMAPRVDPDSGSFITQGIAEQPGRAALPLRTPAEAGLVGEAGAGAAVGAGQAGGVPKASNVDQGSAASGR